MGLKTAPPNGWFIKIDQHYPIIHRKVDLLGPVALRTNAAAVMECILYSLYMFVRFPLIQLLNEIACYLTLLLVRPTEHELTDWRNAPPISEQVRPEDDLPKSSWVKTVASCEITDSWLGTAASALKYEGPNDTTRIDPY